MYVERGGFDEDIDVLEDWILWVSYAYRNRFIYVPKLTSMYRTPADPVKIRQRADAFDMAYPLAVARIDARIAGIERSRARDSQREILNINE
jgi:hypothetical protein